jgi:membrane fusion protein (multidrug efflux system)
MDNQKTQGTKKKSPVRFIIIGVILIAGGFFAFKKISFALTHETTDNAQVETQVTPVLPRVSGYVKHIVVKDYDSVNAGELIVELDDDEMQSQWVRCRQIIVPQRLILPMPELRLITRWFH